MKTKQLMAQLRPWLEEHKRSAFRPRLERGDRTMTGSKFGGYPYLLIGEAWPTCGECTQPLAFLFQLDLDVRRRRDRAHFTVP